MNIHDQKILNRFPRIELSYEIITHKKVYNYEFIMAIPEGTKCFIWFTKYDGKNMCFLLEICNKKKISKIVNIQCSFEFKNDTIFYGTNFEHNKKNVISIENVYYYDGINTSQYLFIKKLYLLNNFFKSIQNVDKNICIGLPIIFTNFLDGIKKVTNLDYKIRFFQFIKKNENREIIINMEYFKKSNTSIKNQEKSYNDINLIIKKKMIFKVKADIQNDIYYLLFDGNESFDIAYISNYQTSVMMNKLFRNIKENENLDALEESDDEEEFQNDELDKYVDLEKEYNMICVYNKKFKKWEPINVTNEKAIQKNEYLVIEKNNC